MKQLAAEVLLVLSDTCHAKITAMLMFSDQPIVPLRAADLVIDWVDTFEYLGVRLDHRLTMRPLIQRVTSRMTTRLLLMNRIYGLD